MSHLHMPAAATTPQVDFYAARRRLVIDGECFPEDPLAFFEPIFAALRRHLCVNPSEPIEALVRLRYVNSASTKAFRNLMLMLEECGKGGASVTVFWEHDEEDDAMAELGQDITWDLHYITMQSGALSS